jgi:dipeptidyl aminopeptidase/acylaminoacyl peptidase
MLTNEFRKTRNATLCILVLFVSTLLIACDDENEPLEESRYLWTPAIAVEKGDGQATLTIANPAVFALYVYPGPARPSHFTIMMSDDGQTFTEHSTVTEPGSVLIRNLDNNRAYYFMVTAHKRYLPSVGTDTLMTIPSTPYELTDYTQTPEGPFEIFAPSFDETYGKYRVNDKLYEFPLSDPGVVHQIDNQTYYARWSPKSNQLVYLKNALVGSVSYPSSINLYDPQTQSSTTLLTIPYENYIVTHPSFSPDESKITFLSNEGNAQAHVYDLWSIDLTTDEKVQLSDFESMGFVTNSPFVWDKPGEEVYLSGDYNLIDTDIYKFNIGSKALTPVVSSKWSEKNPVISPDGTRIAFVSARSGYDELWLYEIASSTYRQITGEPGYNFDWRYSEIQWLDNNTILFSIYTGAQPVVTTVNVNQ